MQIGNFVAIVLMLPFVMVVCVIMSNAGTPNPPHAGATIIFLIISTFTMLGSFIYIIVKNATYLNNTFLIQWSYRHPIAFRCTLAILCLVFVLVFSFLSKKHTPLQKEVRLNLIFDTAT